MIQRYVSHHPSNRIQNSVESKKLSSSALLITQKSAAGSAVIRKFPYFRADNETSKRESRCCGLHKSISCSMIIFNFFIFSPPPPCLAHRRLESWMILIIKRQQNVVEKVFGMIIMGAKNDSETSASVVWKIQKNLFSQLSVQPISSLLHFHFHTFFSHFSLAIFGKWRYFSQLIKLHGVGRKVKKLFSLLPACENCVWRFNGVISELSGWSEDFFLVSIRLTRETYHLYLQGALPWHNIFTTPSKKSERKIC